MTELAGTGRHLSSENLKLWTSFLDASRMIDHALASDLVANHSMTHREYEILVRLDGHGGHMRMSDLARQIVASAPLITQTVERLETRGWVLRQRSTSDSRGIDAGLTADGTAALKAASKPHADIVQRLLLDIVGDSRRAAVADALGDVADHLRSHRAGSPCNSADCPLNTEGLQTT